MNKTITVKSVNIVKTGVREDNTTWMLLNVVDENDRKYSTFDETYLKAVGQTIEIEYEEKESGSNPKNGGKPYLNRNIVQAKAARTGGGKNGVAELNNANGQIIEKLFTKLNIIQAEVEKIGKMLVAEIKTVDEETKQEVLPPF